MESEATMQAYHLTLIPLRLPVDLEVTDDFRDEHDTIPGAEVLQTWRPPTPFGRAGRSPFTVIAWKRCGPSDGAPGDEPPVTDEPPESPLLVVTLAEARQRLWLAVEYCTPASTAHPTARGVGYIGRQSGAKRVWLRCHDYPGWVDLGGRTLREVFPWEHLSRWRDPDEEDRVYGPSWDETLDAPFDRAVRRAYVSRGSAPVGASDIAIYSAPVSGRDGDTWRPTTWVPADGDDTCGYARWRRREDWRRGADVLHACEAGPVADEDDGACGPLCQQILTPERSASIGIVGWVAPSEFETLWQEEGLDDPEGSDEPPRTAAELVLGELIDYVCDLNPLWEDIATVLTYLSDAEALTASSGDAATPDEARIDKASRVLAGTSTFRVGQLGGEVGGRRPSWETHSSLSPEAAAAISAPYTAYAKPDLIAERVEDVVRSWIAAQTLRETLLGRRQAENTRHIVQVVSAVLGLATVIGLSAAIAAVPVSDTLFQPWTQALNTTLLLALALLGYAALATVAMRSDPPDRARTPLIVTMAGLTLLGAAAAAAGLFEPARAGAMGLVATVSLAVASLLALYTLDFTSGALSTWMRAGRRSARRRQE